MNGTQIHAPYKGLIDDDQLVILMGPPGAGKDVQSEHLAADADAVYRSTGALLRGEDDPRLNAIMASGGLVPEAELQRVLSAALRSLEGQPVVLAGVTKKPKEAEWLLEALPDLGRSILVVVELVVSKIAARQRIVEATRGRADDALAVQEQRWSEYRTETSQSLEVYHQAGLLEIVIANGSLDEVYCEIVDVVRRRRLQAAAI